ncbi:MULTISPECIES: AAA family ATPase [Nocardia]|uniref:AAA family ATPase n=1 Tax=Nocardia TaxID=1817 RepID=UPI001300995C|nr:MULTISPECIES: AAA family ATPase [Nocardia]
MSYDDETPTYDDAAERALLGAAMQAPEQMRTHLQAVDPDSWHHLRSRTLAGVITAMMSNGEPVNPTAVLVTAQTRGLVPGRVDPGYVFACLEVAAQPVSAGLLVDRILNLAACRKLYEVTTRTAQRVESSWTTGVDRLDTLEHIAYLKTAMSDVEKVLTNSITAPKPAGVFLAEESEENPWLVPDLFQRMDRLVLTGEEGLGKSEMCCQMAVAMAAHLHPLSGKPLGDDLPPIRVLVVDVENSAAQIRDRYNRVVGIVDGRRRMCGLPQIDWESQDGNLRFSDPRPGGINLLDSRDAAWVESQLSQTSPDVLVMGPLYRLHNENPSEEQPARKLTWIIDQWREQYGFALITEAHAGKALNSTGTRSMAPIGSSVWLRWPEYGFGMRRAKEDAGGKNVEISDFVAWRGARSKGIWPRQFNRSNSMLPWMPDEGYYDELRQAA